MVENGTAQNVHYSAANDPHKTVNTASPSSSKGSHHQMTPSPTDRSRIALPTLEQHANGSLQQQQRALASNSFNCSLPDQHMMHQDAPVAPGNPHDQMQMGIGGLPIKTEMFQSQMANSGSHYSHAPHVNGDAGMYDMSMTSQQQMYAGHPPPHLHNPTSCFPSAASQMMHMSSSQQYMSPYMSSMEDGNLPSSAENSYQIPNGPSDGSMAIGACNDLHENGGRYLK